MCPRAIKERTLAPKTSAEQTEGELRLDLVAFAARALADENRLRILVCVSRGKKSVSRIIEELGLSQPLVSHHLKELKRALLVRSERNGPFVYYEIADPRIIGIVEALDRVASELISNRRTF